LICDGALQSPGANAGRAAARSTGQSGGAFYKGSRRAVNHARGEALYEYVRLPRLSAPVPAAAQ
jgi:hypothetical protein